jgi:type II secretory pathway pseudopilin PulG
MKFFRDNFAYLLLVVIALVLILVTVSLQVAIFSTQTTEVAQSNQGLLYTIRQQLAEFILPNTETPVTTTTATVGQPAPAAVALPTSTPNIIVVQPSPLPPTPTILVVPATATNDPATATLLPGAYDVNAVATRLAAPTVTSAQVAPPVAPTVSALATLATDATPSAGTSERTADFRLGYVASNADCTAVTELMKLILEQEFALQIATIPFAESATLFAKLADKVEAERVDLSFCYVDPDDRSYLQQYFGFLIFIGSGYRQFDNQKFMIMSNAAVKSPIERGAPCLYRFLTNLNLADVELSAGNMAGWYQTHAEQVASWTRCE